MICAIALEIAPAIAVLMLPVHTRQIEILDGERNTLSPKHSD
jgi:hypothetical protein